jgi:hypothetical protein
VPDELSAAHGVRVLGHCVTTTVPCMDG